MEAVEAGGKLRVAGSALLVVGRVQLQGNEEGNENSEVTGPCILPPLPASYACLTPIKVVLNILDLIN